MTLEELKKEQLSVRAEIFKSIYVIGKADPELVARGKELKEIVDLKESQIKVE